MIYNNCSFLQDSLHESEEKYRKAMISIAQLDNEKQALLYQVDCLKDRFVFCQSISFYQKCFAVGMVETEAYKLVNTQLKTPNLVKPNA